jgi:membrane protein involved in colicin uptake
MSKLPAYVASILLLTGLHGCGEQERQPSAAEVRRYTDAIDRAEAEAKAKAVRESRAKEEAVSEAHLERVPRQD